MTLKLGSKNIEGVMTAGTRETQTIAAGMIGNDRPIITTHEDWYSPELGRNLLSLVSDPRVGDTVVRMTKIRRVEPDASLFQPPAGYTIVDQKDPVTIFLSRR